MYKNIFSSFKLRLTYFMIISLLIFSSKDLKAQCAGNDVSFPICGSDIVNSSSQSIDLFSYLVSSGAIPGGTWSNDNLSTGFNVASGILNAQLVNKSAVYNFTYTAPSTAGCIDNTSIVTVTVGGYSGVTGPNGSVCGDESSFNLFQLFNGSANVGPQSNGVWYNNTTNSLSPSIINPAVMALGSYEYTYTIPEIEYTMPVMGSCPKVSSVAFLTIYKPANSGRPIDLLLCETDDLSVYSNLDLNSLLIDEDSNGTWTEGSTNEITSLIDRNVNVQNIYNNYGIGKYSFTYTVVPENAVCKTRSTTVDITIEKQYDFTGSKLVVKSDICEDVIKSATYTVELTQGVQAIPNGILFDVVYEVTGANSGTDIVETAFVNGVLTFPISSSYFQAVGTSIVKIKSIIAEENNTACDNIIGVIEDDLIIYPLPRLSSASMSIPQICRGFNALVNIDGNPDLLDGNYTITYNLSGQNIATLQTSVIVVVGGMTNFTIPSNLIPIEGDTKVTIIKIVNNVTGCENTANVIGDLKINPLPDVKNLAVIIADYCKDEDLEVKISGLGTLTDVIVLYNITGVNALPNQTIPLTLATGSASFVIPAALFQLTGTSVFNIISITNAITGCVSPTLVNDSFVINPIPFAPTATNQSFCETQNATVASLIPNGTQYQWFASPTDPSPLAGTVALADGNYSVRQVDPITKCESPFTTIKVIINKLDAPILNNSGEQFCGLDKPTLQDLANNTDVSPTIQWYDAQTGGNLLPNTTLLQDGVTYYGFNTSITNACLSLNGLTVTVVLTNCPDPVAYDFFIPEGFSPNDDGVNDTFRIPKISFIYPNYSIDIFNRYGNIMFSGNKNKLEWDGKTESGSIGGIAPNGVYFYVINFNKDNKSPLQGRIYLNR